VNLLNVSPVWLPNFFVFCNSIGSLITGMITHNKFHTCGISVHKLLYFSFFSAYFCTLFLPAGIATSISVCVFSFLGTFAKLRKANSSAGVCECVCVPFVCHFDAYLHHHHHHYHHLSTQSTVLRKLAVCRSSHFPTVPYRLLRTSTVLSWSSLNRFVPQRCLSLVC